MVGMPDCMSRSMNHHKYFHRLVQLIPGSSIHSSGLEQPRAPPGDQRLRRTSGSHQHASAPLLPLEIVLVRRDVLFLFPVVVVEFDEGRKPTELELWWQADLLGPLQ